MAEITFGASTLFIDEQDPDTDIDTLDAEDIVGVGTDGNAVIYVGTVSGNVISFGNSYSWQTEGISFVKVAAISATKVLIAYRDNIDNLTRSVICDRANDTATAFNSCGTEAVVDTNTGGAISGVKKLDNTHAAISYFDGSNSYGKVKIATISGNAISLGTEYTYNSANTGDADIAALSGSRIVVAFSNAGSSYDGTAIIGNIASGVITYGSPEVFSSGQISSVSLVGLNSTKFAVAYEDAADSNSGNVIIGEVSGVPEDDISYGINHVFASSLDYGTKQKIHTDYISSNEFYLAYSDFYSNYPGATKASVSDTSVSFDSGGYVDGADGDGEAWGG